mgnify:CR=1 FL=1
MSDSIKELHKTYEKSIFKVSEKDMANFEPNFKIQEELERRNREFLAKSTRKRRKRK